MEFDKNLLILKLLRVNYYCVLLQMNRMKVSRVYQAILKRTKRVNMRKTLGVVMHEQFISEHPDTGFSIAGVEIPSWELILELTAQCYDLVSSGYIGVDIILDRRQGSLC